jgi:uncharacterized protein (DUF433 family)
MRSISVLAAKIAVGPVRVVRERQIFRIEEDRMSSKAESFEGANQSMAFTRITVDPKQMGGVPCIRGLRIPVATVVEMVAEGMSEGEILRAYPDLETEDVREALRYAAVAVREREIPLLSAPP